MIWDFRLIVRFLHLEYIKGNDMFYSLFLQNHTTSNGDRAFEESRAREIFRQIVLAVRYLHLRHIWYGLLMIE